MEVLRIFSEDLFLFFREEHFRVVSLVHDLEHSCSVISISQIPVLRQCLPSEGVSLPLASCFFCVLSLGLKPCVLDSIFAAGCFEDIVIGTLRERVLPLFLFENFGR